MRAALIPVGSLEHGKSRLDGVLARPERRHLAESMLRDVLTGVRGLDLILIITPDPHLNPEGATIVRDPGRGLNFAVDHGGDVARRLGAADVLVLPADVPLAEPADVAALFELDCAVAVVAAGDGGTNALLMRPPGVIPAAFGPSSAAAHLELARARGLHAVSALAASLELDVDDARGLSRLAASGSNRESAQLAAALLRERARVGGG